MLYADAIGFSAPPIIFPIILRPYFYHFSFFIKMVEVCDFDLFILEMEPTDLLKIRSNIINISNAFLHEKCNILYTIYTCKLKHNFQKFFEYFIYLLFYAYYYHSLTLYFAPENKISIFTNSD